MKKFFSIIFFILSVHHAILSVPINFKRLVLFDNEKKLIKMVDLIGDLHLPIQDITKKSSRKRKKRLLKVDERIAFNIAERTLLNTLREMAYGPKREPIMLLWEISHSTNAARAQYLKEVIQPDKIYPFILVTGIKLEKEFNKAASNILVQDTDTLRNFLLFDVFFEDFSGTPLALMTIKEIAQPLYDLVNKIDTRIDKKLNDVRRNYSEEVYQALYNFWNDYLTTKLKPYLDTWVTPYDHLTALEYSMQMRSSNQYIIAGNQFETVTNTIMDFETMANIFSKSQTHIIVYAGSNHGAHLEQKLLQSFGFTVLVNVGDDSNLESTQEVSPQLDAATWKLLKLTPDITLRSYHQKGPLIKKVGHEYWDEIKAILESPSYTAQITESESSSWADVEEEVETASQEHLEQLERWIKKGFAHYLNSANTRLEKNKPLLMIAIEKNNIEMVKLLLKYGAVTNAYWFHEPSNRQISIMEFARHMGNSAIIHLLDQYGAR